MKISPREIIVSVLATLLATLVIGVVTRSFNGLKREIVEEVSLKVEQETQEIRSELGRERRSRCELAAAMLKSGIEIPMSLVIAFSAADTNPELRNVFYKSLNDAVVEIRVSGDYAKFQSQMRKMGREYPALAQLEGSEYILAFSKQPWDNYSAEVNYVGASFEVSDTTTEEAIEPVAYYDSPMKLLRELDLPARDLRTIQVTRVGTHGEAARTSSEAKNPGGT